jgi:hypothetical protein
LKNFPPPNRSCMGSESSLMWPENATPSILNCRKRATIRSSLVVICFYLLLFAFASFCFNLLNPLWRGGLPSHAFLLRLFLSLLVGLSCTVDCWRGPAEAGVSAHASNPSPTARGVDSKARVGGVGVRKNGDFNRRAQFQRREELKQENERIRSLLLLPTFPVRDP